MAEFTQDMLGTAAGTMGVSQEEIPLAMRMAGAAPGILTAAGFMNFRGSNTLIKGGRFDYLDAEARGLKGRKARRIQSKYRVFDSDNVISPMNARQYYGSRGGGLLGRRAARKAAGTGSTFNLRSSMASFRPTAMGRHGSLTSFMNTSMGIYSPYSIAGIGSNFGPIKRRMTNALGGLGVTGIAPDEALLGPGLLSFISAGTRIDRIERKALGGNKRALNKLGRVDRNIQNLLAANNPGVLVSASPAVPLPGTPYTGSLTAPRGGIDLIGPNGGVRTYRGGQILPRNAQMPVYGPSIPGPSLYDDVMRGAVRVGSVYGTPVPMGQVGVRGNLMAASMPGRYGQAVAGYFRGAMGFADVAGLGGAESAAAKGAQLAIKHMGAETAIKYLPKAAKLAGLALPGLNVLAAASLVYDLGNMAGELFKSGINLARDATKSMQGSIHKPLFGMGYRDTEAAATSRQRGVMAIQNSRLNARSMLGSEAGMLAARYG